MSNISFCKPLILRCVSLHITRARLQSISMPIKANAINQFGGKHERARQRMTRWWVESRRGVISVINQLQSPFPTSAPAQNATHLYGWGDSHVSC